jgi:hypothetical protein
MALSPSERAAGAASEPKAVVVAGSGARWERRLQQAALVVGRLCIAYLFFTQLWWKVPPTFGCPADFHFTTGTPSQLQRSSGLCDWIGIESVYATQPRPVLAANLDNRGAPEIAVDIGLLARLNGAFINNIVQPNIRWFGYLIFLAESFIFLSLFFGLFSRLGGLVAIAMSAQLWVGLAGILNPYEWEWSYTLMLVLSLLIFAFAPGRILGLDMWLRPRLQASAQRGSGFARLLLALT